MNSVEAPDARPLAANSTGPPSRTSRHGHPTGNKMDSPMKRARTAVAGCRRLAGRADCSMRPLYMTTTPVGDLDAPSSLVMVTKSETRTWISECSERSHCRNSCDPLGVSARRAREKKNARLARAREGSANALAAGHRHGRLVIAVGQQVELHQISSSMTRRADAGFVLRIRKRQYPRQSDVLEHRLCGTASNAETRSRPRVRRHHAASAFWPSNEPRRTGSSSPALDPQHVSCPNGGHEQRQPFTVPTGARHCRGCRRRRILTRFLTQSALTRPLGFCPSSR